MPPRSVKSRTFVSCVEDRGRISPSGRTHYKKWVHAPHQWIAQRQVAPVSVYCDRVGCRVLCLRHDIPVWQHTSQSTTATNRQRDGLTSDVKATLFHKARNMYIINYYVWDNDRGTGPRDIRIDETAGRGDLDSCTTIIGVIK